MRDKYNTSSYLDRLSYDFLFDTKNYDALIKKLKRTKSSRKHIEYVQRLKSWEEKDWNSYVRRFFLLAIFAIVNIGILISAKILTYKSFLNPAFILYISITTITLFFALKNPSIYSKVDKVQAILPTLFFYTINFLAYLAFGFCSNFYFIFLISIIVFNLF